MEQKEKTLDDLVVAQEGLYELLEHLDPSTRTVTLESGYTAAEYLYLRQIHDAAASVGLEALSFQDVKNTFAAMGKVATAMGTGFMKFLDTVHEVVDSTYLVKTDRIRRQFRELEGKTPVAGFMERKDLGRSLSIGNALPSEFGGISKDLIDFSRTIMGGPVPELAGMTRRVSARLEAKRWMGRAAFNAEVLQLADIIGSIKPPMALYGKEDTQRLYPGNRTIFTQIRPKRPVKEPDHSNAAVRRVVDAVSNTTLGVVSSAKSARGEGVHNLPVLSPEQAGKLLSYTDGVLREILRVANQAKSYRKDQLPSTMSLMVSGLYHDMAKTFNDFWTSTEDGFGEFEGANGGQMKRIKPGSKGMLGPFDGLPVNTSMEAMDEAQKSILAVWVTRYLKLTAVDHARVTQSLLTLLMAVARSYIEYAEESLKYYK